MFLPIASDLGLALLCPTIILRYNTSEKAEMEPAMRAQLIHYRGGLRSGNPITIQPADLDAWNRCQVSGGAAELYASEDGDFDAARAMLAEKPEGGRWDRG